MANFNMIPYNYFLPISLISFILVFFLPTNTQVTLNKKYDINMTNYTNNNLNDLSLFKNKNEKNITETCKNFLNDTNNKKEIYLINKFNLTIKIFILCILNHYDDDNTEGICEGLMCDFFSCEIDEYENMGPQGFSGYSIFIIICLGIIFLSAFSIYFSLEIKDKMIQYCNFELGEDYDIDLWIISKVLLGIMIALYFIEISLCVYSICFGMILFIKKRKMNLNNLDNENLFI